MVSVLHALPKPGQPLEPDAWLASLPDRYSADDVARLRSGLDYSRGLYGDHRSPLTGELWSTHALAAAAIVVEMKLDVDAVLAALLFVVPDYRPDFLRVLTERYGEPLARLVDGVSRMRRINDFTVSDMNRLQADERQLQVESMRKMLLAMVEDMRVVLVKLAWRTQTMHYLSKVPADVAARVARETMDIFAPLANRLGVWQIKWELEDLAFRYLEPLTYKKIAKLLDERRLDRQFYIERIVDDLRHELHKVHIKAEVTGRAKHIYSIWRKMQKKHLDFSELYDVRAVRVLVDEVKDCYAALGIVHHLWRPIPGEFDDYISQPKGNAYQSLHTAVIGPEDKAIEVQIRTWDMHRHAEFGVAAHWRYKEGGEGDARYEEKIAWLRQLLEWRDNLPDTDGDLAEQFKTELFADTVYVLTPQGKVIGLPVGSTPVDFAYHIHTELGHRCRGAKVNGSIVPLNYELKHGERVEILSAKEGGPSLDWLHQGYVRSHRAQTKIRTWIRAQQAEQHIAQGRDLVEREAQRQGVAPLDLDALAQRLSFPAVEAMLQAIGAGDVSNRALTQGLLEQIAPPPAADLSPEELIRASRAEGTGKGILLNGVDQLMTQLARCCKPVPPDPVIGFITRGRGVSIHRRNCATLKRLASGAPERLIPADWGTKADERFSVDIEVLAHDRPGLLRDISEVFSRDKANVTAVNTQSRNDRARMRFTVEINDASQLQRMLRQIDEIVGVLQTGRA